MTSLPTTVAHYKSTPEFTQDTVPAGLQRDHTTAAGVWGKIVILDGALEYHIVEPAPSVQVLAPGIDGVVVPQMKHHLVLTGPVRFRVDFHR